MVRIASSGPETLAADVGRAARADQAGEGVLDARREPGGHQRTGDGRPTEGIVVARVQRGDLGVDRQFELTQAIHSPGEPETALVALADHRRLECLVRGVHPEAEDVQLTLPQAQITGHQCIDLDPGDERHPRRDCARPPRPVGSRPACRDR